MTAIDDRSGALRDGLVRIREQFAVPTGFAPDVIAAADEAARRAPTEHVDRTDVAFVTLDPATATDLDQAFTIEAAGADLILRYAIADVGWFVRTGDPVDVEAWARGLTLYLPDGKAPLYPPALAEGAASLLPDGPRPAVIFAVRIGTDGVAALDGAERAVIHSRAKLAYDSVRAEDLPPLFDELSRRVAEAERRRGASRIEAPEQAVEQVDGAYRLVLRARLESEDRNAAMSLSANLAVADALLQARTGLFRTMPEPDERAIKRLRHTAAAFGIAWSADESLTDVERRLDASDPKHAAFALATRRAGGGADYVPYRSGERPWHAAMAATYAHATAPLRRLADRHTVEAALAVANGDPVPEHVAEAFQRLPDVMQRAEAVAAQIDRAVVDLAEAVALSGHEGESFDAVVTDDDERGARIQLRELPVVTRVSAHRVDPGDPVRVRLDAVDVGQRQLRFTRVG